VADEGGDMSTAGSWDAEPSNDGNERSLRYSNRIFFLV
jgi:hypothetical protein